MKIIPHRLRRFIQRIYFKAYKSLNPDSYFDKDADYYKEAFGICHKLISNPSSTLLISPLSGKRYIKSDDAKIFIVIQKDSIDIVNHVYSYNIKVDGSSLYDRISRVFDNEVEKRRSDMEEEIKNNVTHSLKEIYKNIDSRVK